MHQARGVPENPLKHQLKKVRAKTCQSATCVGATTLRLIPFFKRNSDHQGLGKSSRSRNHLGTNAFCVLTHQLTPCLRNGPFANWIDLVDGCEHDDLALFDQDVPAELRHIQRCAKPSRSSVGPGVQSVPRHTHLLRNAAGTDVNAPLKCKRPLQLHISLFVASLMVGSTPWGYGAIALSLASVRQKLMKAVAL
jgi:hypothetical protein